MGLDEFLVVTVSIALLVVVVHGVLVARAVLISGLDINPLIAGPSGCVAVDVLIAREPPGLSREHPRLCCIYVRPGRQRAAIPRARLGGACRRRRCRAANPGGGPSHGAAQVGRRQHHAAYRAGTRP
jgi:hypothetical protein